MELDQVGAQEDQHEPSSLSTPTSTESSQSSTDISPVTDETTRAADHDSLVTVRLSEPPTLQANTNVVPNALPPRKSLYGHEYTPSDAMAEPVKEEVEEEAESDEDDDDDLTPLPNIGRSLEDELEDNDNEEYAALGRETAGEQAQEDTHATDSRPSLDSDVDWHELQKTEDEESRGQDADNVGASLSLVRWAVLCVVKQGEMDSLTASLQVRDHATCQAGAGE